MKRARGRSNAEPAVPDRTPLIHDTPHQFSVTSNRDSDASYGTNRQSYSSSLARAVPINDKAYKESAFRTINNYLSSHSLPFSLKPPLPSAKDITDTIRFIFSRLDWPTNNIKLEDDLPLLMKHLSCPFKLNKSILKAPGTPHTWPALLAVIHWFVEMALYNDHISDSTLSANTSVHSYFQTNDFLAYALKSYSCFIGGDDNTENDLDCEFFENLEQKKEATAGEVRKLEEEVFNLEEKIQALRSAPSVKENLERDKTVLEEDIQKFHALIDQYERNNMELEKDLEKMEKELNLKKSENRLICEKNEELKRALDAQRFNLRDVEKMRREIQALEREISEAEVTINECEEKSSDLDARLRKQLRELEGLSVECNLAIRRLKIGDDKQYKLNREGSNPVDILGNDYKSTLKPALVAFADDLKKSSMEKLEETILLQQQLHEIQSKVAEKRSHLSGIQFQIDEVESQLSLTDKKIKAYSSKCDMEAKRMGEDIEQERHRLDNLERKAEDDLRRSKEKLQDVVKQNDEKIRTCARELLMLIDSVSKYKEHMESTVLDMKKDFSETIEAVTNAYNNSLEVELGTGSKVLTADLHKT